MRLGLLLLLLGCGEVQKLAPDAPPNPDIDAPENDGPPPGGSHRLFALTEQRLDLSNSKTGIEIVDLDTMTMVRRFELQIAGMSAMAVAPDGKRAYLGDFANQQLRVVDLTTGVDLQQMPLPGIRDLVLSADGNLLFAATGSQIVKLDTATGTVLTTTTLGTNTTTIGLALSIDGALLATSTTDGGTNPTVMFVATADGTVAGKASITTPVTGCSAFPDAVRFAGPNVLLAWDSNCDAMYEVDASSFVQLTNKTIPTGRDSGTAGFPSSRFAVSSNGRAYAVREAADVAVMNLATGNFAAIGGFGDTPFAATMSEDGKQLFVAVIHRFNGGGADTLDVIDTATNTVQHGIYTFADPTESMVDGAVVTMP